ncbi:unnamed protein product [Rotaria socialis]|uniref:Uncharacterized protein n=1 Tax=Rotaria socialis TaxID=392032 RepID=A0A819XJE4_9BILA|nr:unnamed protein product [Rotaria socialis]CAF4137076.1 unnamed protein product [Rotaria socialis]
MSSNAVASGNTYEEIEVEVNILTPYLPIAELLNGGINRLTGLMDFFNVDSFLELTWLKSKMISDEYRGAITYVNICAINSQVGAKTYFS